MGCFCIGIVTMGGISVFNYCMAYMAMDFGIDATGLAIVTSTYTLFCNGLSWFAGIVCRKLGPRLTIGLGMCGNSIAQICTGLFANGVLSTVICYSFAGAFACTLVGSVMPKLISDWFSPRHRGKCNMFYTMGPTLMGALLGIVIPILINGPGWRTCFYGIGGFCLLLGIIFLLIVRDTPAKLGTYAFGYTEEEAAMLVESLKEQDQIQNTTGKALKKVLSYPMTWIFGIVYALWMGYFAGMNTFGNAALIEIGFDITFIGAINSVSSIVMVGSQLLWSTMSDYVWNRKAILALICIIFGAMMFGLFYILGHQGTSVNHVFFFGFMIVYAIFGGQGALMNTINCEIYPPSIRAVGPGIVATISMIGSVGGPLVCAAVVRGFGATFGYLLFTGPCQIVAAILLWILVPKTGGKHGDPLAIKEAEETLGEEAVAAARS